MIPVPVIALPPLFGDDRFDVDDLTLNADLSITGPLRIQIEEPEAPFVDASQHLAPSYVKGWDDFVGQEPLKSALRAYIDDTMSRCDTLPHVGLFSPDPGVGKTTVARLIAEELQTRMTMIVPPFSATKLHQAALQMQDWEVLFIDEIHIMAQKSENLLHLMEEGVLYLEDGVHKLADFTVIGATTDAGKLPRAVLDRFEINPRTGVYFQPYTLRELVRISKNFADFFEVSIRPETLVAIAKACRGAPRDARDLVVATRAVDYRLGRQCDPKELLTFVQVEPDGMTRQHIAYVLWMYQFGRRYDRKTELYYYIAGEMTMLNALNEIKPTLGWIEKFLVQRGLLVKTSSGRQLTELGERRAQEYLARGMGLTSG